MVAWLLVLTVLLVGAVLLSLLYEAVAGNESFSLPFVNILLVIVAGAAGYLFFGWPATGGVLCLYLLWAVGGGLLDRRRFG